MKNKIFSEDLSINSQKVLNQNSVHEIKDLIIQSIKLLDDFSNPEKKSLIKSIKLMSYEEFDNLESRLNPKNFIKNNEGDFGNESPKKDEDIFLNLNKIINEFPSYVMSNDLSVFKKNNLSKDTDAILVYHALCKKRHNILKELHLIANLPHDKHDHSVKVLSSELIAIKLAILLRLNKVIKLYKPKKIVPIAFFIENSIKKDSPDVFLPAIEKMIQSKITTVITKTILYNNLKEFDTLFAFSLCDIYMQENGGFILILPKNSNLEELGFNTLKHFKKLSMPIQYIPATPLNFNEDIKKLFISESQDYVFHRLVSIQGHGLSPSEESYTNEGQIAGLSILEFQMGMKTLQENGMIFLHLFSCYSGGINSTKIHTIDGVTPCPVLVESSLDLPVFSSHSGYDRLFKETEKLLFKNYFDDKKTPMKIHHLSQKDMMKIARLTPLNLSEDKKNYLNSLAMSFFPNNLSDIPKVRYVLPTLSLIFDIHKNLKKLRKKGLDNQIIEVPVDRSTLLFSDPVINSSIVIKGQQLILISGGGNAQHLIKELDASNLNILNIAKMTFESSIGHPSPAKKAYFFGSVKCLYHNNAVELQNCMIKKTDTECLLLFKVKGEENSVVIRYVIKSNWMTDEKSYEPLGEPTALSSNEIDLLVYETLYETKASELTLKQIGTTIFNKNILSEFDSIFWPDKKDFSIKDESSLYSNIIQIKMKISALTKNLTLEEVIKFTMRYPLIAKYINEKWHNNEEFLMTLLPHAANVMEIASPETILKLLPRLPQDEAYLKYISASAKSNQALMVALIQHNFYNFDYLTSENKADPVIMLAAVKLHPDVFPYIAESLKNDEEFLIQCLEVAPHTFKHMSEAARSNPELIQKAISQNQGLENDSGMGLKN